MRPADRGGRWLSREEYRELARGMERSLFRLQVHPVYSVASEQEEFQRFLDTGTYEIEPDDGPLVRMRESTATGKLSQRVYVVTRPFTDYQRYVFRYYHHLAKAGEDLRILDTTRTSNPGLPDFDFMLLDDETVIKLHYAPEDGTYLGPELLIDANPDEYRAHRDDAVRDSIPFSGLRGGPRVLMLDPADLGRDHVSLSDALRMLRKASGLSGDRLAQRARMSQSKVSKIETGRVLPTVMDVERIVAALDVPPGEAAKLLRSARAANTGFESRRAGHQRGAVRRQTDFAALMSQAEQVRYVLPTMLSGLLQTPAYVRSNVNHQLSKLWQGERAKLITAKLARQAVLDDPSKRFTFVLTEAAVRCRIAALADMAEQVEHLVALSRRVTVDIEVIPLSAHLPNAPINIFAIYDERLVTVETEAGTLALRDPQDVREHLDLFEHFRGRSLKGQECRDFLALVAADFRAS